MTEAHGIVKTAIELGAAMNGISVQALTAPSREEKVANVRHGIAWVLRRGHGVTLERIARGLGRSNHVTVINAVRKAERLRIEDPNFLIYTDTLLAAVDMATITPVAPVVA